MEKGTTSEAEVVELRRDIRSLLHQRLLEAVEIVLEEELSQVLGTERYERSVRRRGYRNGSTERRITTPVGTQELRVPRARVITAEGSEEFRSKILPRYARRTCEVDEAILACYLAGANSRRIRKALEPLLGTEHLSKSAVSRVVGRLKHHFAEWCERDLSEEVFAIVFLDGFHLKVRLARRVMSVPVLATLGVAEDGRKVLVALRIALKESAAHWSSLVADLQRRGLRAPVLIVSDGHAGLRKATQLWPESRVQRCTQHKWQNLVDRCPVHARKEMKRDWDRIIYAVSGMEAREARAAFLAKWSTLCPAVARSLKEAGEQLLTFYEFPKGLWKSLRTTNSLENLNREFRRRTKTQASFSTEEAALTLLWGLVAFGQIRMRKIDGYRSLPALLASAWESAA
jgi:transposase-like protein